MKILPPLALIALLTSCGPSPSTDSTDSQTTKTTTTETTTTSVPAAGSPAATGVPPAAPMVAPGTLTQANLDRISNDMSKAEVEAILGPPTSSSSEPIPIVGGTQTTYNYQSGNSAITIVLKNDQVKSKSGTFNP